MRVGIATTPLSAYMQTGSFIKFTSSPLKSGSPLFLKLGLSYFSNAILFTASDGSYLKTTHNSVYFTADGKNIDRDSITMKQLSLAYQNQNINFETAFLLSTNDDKKITFIYGMGAMIGLNYNGYSKITYSSYKYTTDYIQGTNLEVSNNRNEENIEEEILKSKANFSFGGSVCLGYDIKLNKKLSFFNDIRLAYRADKISNYKFIGARIYQLMFGIKYWIR